MSTTFNLHPDPNDIDTPSVSANLYGYGPSSQQNPRSGALTIAFGMDEFILHRQTPESLHALALRIDDTSRELSDQYFAKLRSVESPELSEDS